MIFDENNFPSLPPSWDSLDVDSSCGPVSIKKKIATKEYLETGILAIVDQGSDLIGGYWNDLTSAVETELPVIIFGDHTRILKYIDFPFAAGADGIKILRPYVFFHPRLFYRFLQIIKLPDRGYSRHFQFLRNSRIPVPPENEQKRIADKLDAVLARVDACRDRLDRIPAILKRFRQSVLAAATSGELTEDWRKHFNCQKEWNLVSLADIGDLGRGKSKHRPRNDPRLYGGQYPFIQTGAVAQSGGYITSHSQTYSDFGLSQSKLWPAGTVCITIAANIADTAILTYPACFPDSVVGFIANPAKCIPQFAKWSIDVISDQLESFAPATAQKNINLAVLNDVRFQCPEIEEQTEIVRRVESLFAYSDRMEARYLAARAQVEKLTPALLAKAFRGELVPQDPDDEPTSELLARIATARPADNAKKVRKPSSPKTVRTAKEKAIMTKSRQDDDVKNQAYLAGHLRLLGGSAEVEKLFKAAELPVADFYKQLAWEVERGFVKDGTTSLEASDAA